MRCEADEGAWSFLCLAALRAPGAPPQLDATLQLPPLCSPRAELLALHDRGCTLRAHCERLPRPAGCALACVSPSPADASPPPAAQTLLLAASRLLPGRLLLPGALLHLSAVSALKVERAEAAAAVGEGTPLRCLPRRVCAPRCARAHAVRSTRVCLVAAPPAAPPASASSSPSPEPAEARVAGRPPALQLLRELLLWPQLYGAEAAALGVRWPRGVLLHGPPGTGKTLAARCAAAEAGAAVFALGAAELVGAFAGESERALRRAWGEAEASARGGRPTLLLLDELDALCPRRAAGSEAEARLTAQLLVLMDGGGGGARAEGGARLLVVGCTNRPEALDGALRRPGRFERELEVPVPDAAARRDILALHARRLPLAPGLLLAAVADRCHGYSGADLAALAREAAMGAVEEAAAGGGALRPLAQADWDAALRRCGASVVRGVAAEAAPVSWDEIGGLGAVKARLRQAVEWPLLHAARCRRLGLRAPRGVLLHGPPGCSKTQLARAAATAAGVTLVPLSGAQLFSCYLGEGERALASAFARARAAAPAIVLLDEADGVCARRGEGPGGGSGAEERLLCALLAELDGLAPAAGVLLLACTNRPGALDDALLRPGRLDVQLYVPPPDAAGRLEVLRIHSRAQPLAPCVDLGALAAAAERATGAELKALCAEAAAVALREDPHAQLVRHCHFLAALAAAPPALSPERLAEYERFEQHRRH